MTGVDSLWLSDVRVVAWPLFTWCVMLLHGVCMCGWCGFFPGSVMSGWWHGPCSLGVSCCYMECVCVTCVDSIRLSDVWMVAWPLFTWCVMLLHGVCMCDLCGFHPAQ